MKRAGRIGIISKIFNENPNQIFPLSYFCQRFDIAKSTASEDISILKNTFAEMNIGIIETISGPNGGIRFSPIITKEFCLNTQNDICKKLSDSSRILGGGFLYTSDIMFQPSLVYNMAKIFAYIYKNRNADYIVTIETKGVPLAFMTAKLLDIPMVVVRTEPKISEGPTISINYFAGTAGRMQKMSVAKKAVKSGTKAIIIDDFMRAGGSIKGIYELMGELDVQVVGVGVAIASKYPENKKVADYDALVYMEDIDEESHNISMISNDNILHKYMYCKF